MKIDTLRLAGTRIVIYADSVVFVHSRARRRLGGVPRKVETRLGEIAGWLHNPESRSIELLVDEHSSTTEGRPRQAYYLPKHAGDVQAFLTMMEAS